jgi:hypothetical protein
MHRFSDHVIAIADRAPVTAKMTVKTTYKSGRTTETKFNPIAASARSPLPTHVASLLASAHLSPPEKGEKFTVAAVDRALAGKGISERLWIKAALHEAGLLA